MVARRRWGPVLALLFLVLGGVGSEATTGDRGYGEEDGERDAAMRRRRLDHDHHLYRLPGGINVGSVSVPWQPSNQCVKLTWQDLISSTHKVRDFDGHMEQLREDEAAQKETMARGLFREVLPKGGLMKMAFATPVYRVNLTAFVDGLDVEKFNANLEAVIWNHYQQVWERERERLEREGGNEGRKEYNNKWTAVHAASVSNQMAISSLPSFLPSPLASFPPSFLRY